MASILDDEYKVVVREVRNKWGRVTPLRLGLQVGKAGLDLPPPYAPGGMAERRYKEGVEWGRARASKRE